MTSLQREKLACSYFFVIPALAFGILSSRLPAIKEIAKLNNSQVGTLLLALGIATLLGLFLADFLIERKGAKPVTTFSALALMIFIICAGFSSTFFQLMFFLSLTGLGVGFCDVGMNALGIDLEQTHKIHCLAFLHACSGIGGAFGSLTGFAFSWLSLPPCWNFLVILGVAALFLAKVYAHIPAGRKQNAHNGQLHTGNLPFFLWFCGIMSLLCHVAEGSSGEWGSILLTSKGASHETAALVFAFFTAGLVTSRFCTDSLRYKISDFHITLFGSLAGFLAMAFILLSDSPLLCLCCYAIFGFSLGPITPILFSRSGALPGVTPGQASAVISVFSYSGLLLFPPFLGMIGERWGLTNSLWIIALFCLCMAAGSLLLRRR